MNEVDQYDYHLPRERIAQQPLAQRTDARLLVVRREDASLEHHHVRDLPQLLDSGDCLVVNDTRVVPARLVGRRTASGGRWEGLFLELDPSGLWRVMSKTRGKLRPGETVTLEDRLSRKEMQLTMLTKQPDGTWVVRPDTNESPWDLLDRIGRVPLPPYIRDGEMQDADRKTYQTTYAKHPGAVAAPTAGLHFTPSLFAQLEAAGVPRVALTLHVGVGTFRPISVPALEQHAMHAEWGRIDEHAARALQATRKAGGRIVAVGTTAVRVLETAAAGGTIAPWTGNTELFIRPPYRFTAVDALLTNFHLPRSTLLVLVRTFGGDELIRRAYAEAIEQQYRFYSYGDAMLIL